MPDIPISEVRENLSDLANRVALRGERMVIERRGKRLCALVCIEDLELLERFEDAMDLDAVRSARDDASIPWANVKKKLGL